MKTSTYCDGPVLTCTKDVTKAQIVTLCTALTDRLRKQLKDETLVIKPEPVSEGGFYYTGGMYQRGTGKSYGYKSFQIQHNQWWILQAREVETTWPTSNQPVFLNGQIMQTKLKALYDAPAWTDEELAVFNEEMQRIGLVCSNIPTKDTLHA